MNILLRKIQRNQRDYGSKTTIIKGLSYVLKPFYESVHFRIYYIELEKIQLNRVERKGFLFEVLNKNDFEKIIQIVAMEEWLNDIINKKMEEKGLCFIVSKDSEVVGFNLISLDEVYIPLIKQKRILKEFEAWSDQISVKKKYRKTGIATDLRYFTFLELRRRGIKKLSGGALLRNEASLRLARKTGFKEITDVHFLKVLGYKKWKYYKVK
jgi:GNAT superfamily N-acetyltransferase